MSLGTRGRLGLTLVPRLDLFRFNVLGSVKVFSVSQLAVVGASFLLFFWVPPCVGIQQAFSQQKRSQNTYFRPARPLAVAPIALQEGRQGEELSKRHLSFFLPLQNKEEAFEDSAAPRRFLPPLEHLRFLTAVDFPPFNYLDNKRHLLGYNIDLARALCQKLHREAVCEIEALPWENLPQALEKGVGDAIIAGLKPTKVLAKAFLFTTSYFPFPARFVAWSGYGHGQSQRKNCFSSSSEGGGGSFCAGTTAKTFSPPFWQGLSVAVVENTVHARLAEHYFPEAHLVAYPRKEDALQALKSGRVALYFGDALQEAALLNGQNDPQRPSEGHYYFVGLPYYAPQILGEGLQIAVRKADIALWHAFNNALQELAREGFLQKLYLRYFPIDFF